MANTVRYENINRIPALTWNWLRLNRATLEAEIIENKGTAIMGGLPKDVNGADSPLTCRMVPSFGALLPERVRAMQGGAGKDADALLDALGVQPTAIVAKKGAAIAEPITVRTYLADGKSHADRTLIVAEPSASLTVIMVYALPDGARADAGGFHAEQTKIWVQQGARVHLVKVNLLGARYTHLDDTAAYCEDGARIDVTQVELGAAQSYVGVAATLAGYQSAFKSDTAYHCRAAQLLDMNYAVWHTGAKTDTQMRVKGVVADDAVKVYRGTIDFKRGCAGATGDEQDETLLLSPTAVNKSIPMILCDEEDVSGTHGATIGRLSADELFYMQSRGISEDEAKRMMTRAKVASVAHLIPDDSVVAEIAAYLDASAS